jgi:uncharacterized membrane protein YeaQ/YmgE (transglycosylase-associated protein family)
MHIVLWTLLGMIAGWGSITFLRSKSGEGHFTDLFLGIIGALMGGLLMTNAGSEWVISGVNWASLIAAGAVAVALVSIRQNLE